MVELRAEQTTAIRWPGLRPALLYSVKISFEGSEWGCGRNQLRFVVEDVSLFDNPAQVPMQDDAPLPNVPEFSFSCPHGQRSKEQLFHSRTIVLRRERDRVTKNHDTYNMMSSAILSGNLPTLVPPNFCTIQLLVLGKS
jgi:hypothetical protein